MTGPRNGEARTVVITGVTKGLGRAMARRFAALGHRVGGCGRTREEVDRLANELGPEHDVAVADVSDFSQVAAWGKRLLERFGAPDLLLNNAAMANRLAPLWKVPPEEFSRLVDINIKGVAHVIDVFAPAMVARRTGVIVNFSSGWGRSVSPQVAPYCASKWAMEGLSKALAEELPKGMAAVPLNPGVIETDMLHVCFGAEASAYPDPEQWAEAAVPFLLGLGPRDNGRSVSVPGF